MNLEEGRSKWIRRHYQRPSGRVASETRCWSIRRRRVWKNLEKSDYQARPAIQVEKVKNNNTTSIRHAFAWVLDIRLTLSPNLKSLTSDICWNRLIRFRIPFSHHILREVSLHLDCLSQRSSLVAKNEFVSLWLSFWFCGVYIRHGDPLHSSLGIAIRYVFIFSSAFHSPLNIVWFYFKAHSLWYTFSTISQLSLSLESSPNPPPYVMVRKFWKREQFGN